MKPRRATTSIVPIVASLGLLVGCQSTPQAPDAGTRGGPVPPVLQEKSVQINNDRALLESHLRRTSRTLFVRMKETPGRQEFVGAEKSTCTSTGLRLTLVGEVQPPTVDGFVVQANDIEIRGSKAVVAYNYAGDVFKGALQVIDFAHPDRPELVSEVLYSNADVDAVALEGSHLYAGLASDDPALVTPALLSELKLTGTGLERTDAWLDLPSWAVTDLAVSGNDLVASVGAKAGGVARLERNELRLVAFADAPDARGVDLDERTVMSVCGTQGSLTALRLPDLGVTSRVEVPGYRNENAKGTIEVLSHRCYLGAGDGGFQVLGTSGELQASMSNAAFSDVRPDLMVVNAVTVQGTLAFVAAGPLGVQVVDLGRFSDSDGSRNAGMRVLGELDFEDSVSSNMVKARNDILVVAAGLGGVKLVRMETIESSR